MIRMEIVNVKNLMPLQWRPSALHVWLCKTKWYTDDSFYVIKAGHATLSIIIFFCLLSSFINHFADCITSTCIFLTQNLKHFTHIWLNSQLTPCVVFLVSPMGDFADVLLSTHGREEGTLGQVEVPVLFEGQVCLIGVSDFLSILQQLDGDVRGVEATHIANQDVFLSKLAWFMAVHLNLGWSCWWRW